MRVACVAFGLILTSTLVSGCIALPLGPLDKVEPTSIARVLVRTDQINSKTYHVKAYGWEETGPISAVTFRVMTSEGIEARAKELCPDGYKILGEGMGFLEGGVTAGVRCN